MANASIVIPRRARAAEIARLAGVGTATVDRVLNNRPHVSAATRQRVEQAKAAIESGAQAVVPDRPWRLKVFLPDEAGPSTEYLAACFQEVGAMGAATIECVFTEKMEPAILARKLRACSGQGVDGIAFQALEDPRVRDAVEELEELKIPCIALVSGMHCSALAGFVGIDNRAAGRTAGILLGQMIGRRGRVVVISGGQLYRSHEDREMGFRALLRREFPDIEVLGTYSGHDDIDGNYRTILRLLEEHPQITGVYNVGGGNEGVVHALQEAGKTADVTFFGHNLTPKTKTYLLDGSMDIILHQNMRRASDQAVQALIARLEGRAHSPETVPIEVITRENIGGSVFG